MYTLLYLKWTTNKALLYSTGNSAQCYTGGHVCVSLLRHICINYIPPHLTIENTASDWLSMMALYTSVERGLSFQYKRKKIANTLLSKWLVTAAH